MARTARASKGGYFYHVLNRGNARQSSLRVIPSAEQGGQLAPRSLVVQSVERDKGASLIDLTRGQLKAGFVVLSDGSQYSAKECPWVIRAQGNARRS